MLPLTLETGNMSRLEHPDAVTLVHSAGGSASIALHGAQLLGWRDDAGRERIYLSRVADMSGHSAIRGGIPIIFPQFGTGPLPKHGFLRTRRWSLTSHAPSAAVFRITDDDATRSMWPYPFLCELAVELSSALRLRFTVHNTGDSHFEFTAALHNYFAVDSVERASVAGLHGLGYVDKVAAGVLSVDSAPRLELRGETDRVYLAGPRRVEIEQAIGSSSTRVDASGFSDWVVWNPWREASAALGDMEPTDYEHMLCVEAAQIAEPVRLAPGETWTGEQVISTT